MTRSLFGPRAWGEVTSAIGTNGPILVGLDLDGTLAAIVDHPDRARVTPTMLKLLARCARTPRIRVAIVSARSTATMRKLIPTPGILRIGQYGLEGRLAPSMPRLASYRLAAAEFAGHARLEISDIPGVWVEYKRLSVAIHDRRVANGHRASLRRAVQRLTPTARRLGFHLVHGQRVQEFVPDGFDKGTALRGLIDIVQPATTLYFGDSRADEPAFRALGPGDVPVRVGPGPTRAPFRVDGPRGVARVLSAVVRIRSAGARVSRR